MPNFESPTTTNAQLHVALANVAAAAAAFQHQQQQFQQHQQQQSLQQQQQQQKQQQSNICSSSSSHHQSSSSSGASNGPIQQSFGHITGLQHFNRMVAPSALAAVAAASSFLPLPPLPPPPPPGLASLWATFASPRANQSSQSSYISSSMSHAKVAADAAVAATINSEHNLFEAQCLQEVATNSGGSAAENSLSSPGVSSTTSPSSSTTGSPNNSSSSLLSIAEQQQQQQSSTSQSVGVTAGDSSSSSPSSSSTVTNKNCSPSAHFSPNAADQSFNPFGPAIFDFSRLGMTGGLNALLSSGSPSSEALPGGGGSGPRSRSHSVLVHPHHPLSFAAVANGGHHSMAISSPIISSSSGPGSGSGSPSNAVVAFTKEEKDLELKAKSHREAASRLNECDKIYSITRFDNKPPRDAQYSTKVFIGGVPWDMNNDDMMEVFEPFGATSIQRPGKDVRLSRSSQGLDKAGYLYLIFESEPHVHSLLKYCKLEMTDGGHRYFYMLYSKRSKKEKRVQVIPWNTADSVCMVNPAAKEDQARTVFLGALHGMMNSKAVVDALTRIFGPVEFVSLDTDKYKYPMGSGRAMFTRHSDYLKAVNAGFVRVKSDRFEKTVSESSKSLVCLLTKTVCYFCRFRLTSSSMTRTAVGAAPARLRSSARPVRSTTARFAGPVCTPMRAPRITPFS